MKKHTVAWCPNEIWYGICVAECVLVMNPADLFGQECTGFDAGIHNHQLSPEETGVDATPAA